MREGCRWRAVADGDGFHNESIGCFGEACIRRGISQDNVYERGGLKSIDGCEMAAGIG